ncbi:MAG TPA: cellulase family glycosylhydrolase [Candidatus Saccharimonadales bacterium]|nr:cellulase family glycosylhydrolase [Candidatus Saccharimonadales bacterium]
MPSTPICGVNLGGWLVLERWITPSLFAGTSALDEHSYCAHADQQARDRLRQFRDTFITREDFVWLAAHDIQAVRLPVGYWVFGDESPFQETISYVDRVFEWAEDTGFSVLIDFHGLPGSQNGRDHSGHAGATNWHRDTSYVQRSMDTVTRLAERYHDRSSLLGISLINEPHPRIPKRLLTEYYEQAYARIRRICGSKPWIVFSDGYLPVRWKAALPMNTYPGTVIDTHHYQIFTPLDKALSSRAQLWRTRHQLPRKLHRLAEHHPVIVGEWSLTLNDRAYAGLSSDQHDALARSYAAAQMAAFRDCAAWFFWTYKTEAGGSWSLRDCEQRGWMGR